MKSNKPHEKSNRNWILRVTTRVVSIVTALGIFVSGMADSVMLAYGQETSANTDNEPVIISQNHIQAEKAASEIKENTYYILVSQSTGMAMTVEGYSDGNDAGICQMDIGKYSSQVWSLKAVTKDNNVYYQIINYHSGKALNVPRESTEEGKQIIQWNQGDGGNCIFSLTELSDGFYRISSKHMPTFSIKVKDNSAQKGAAVVQGTYAEVDNDGWQLVEIAKSDIVENPGLETPKPREAIEAFIKAYTYVDGNGVAQLKNCGGFWAEAETIEMLIDAYEQLGDEKYRTLMINQVDGFLNQHTTNWNNPYNDDIMWATIMCVRTYLLTGDEKYLHCAESNFAKAYNRGWSEDMGGGIWWKVFGAGETPSKNSCANGPAAVAACLLGEATGDTSYYEKAKGLIDWQVSKMYVAEGDDAGKVYDSLNINEEYNYWASTYNQGTFIGACTMLYQHYNEQKYFDYANTAANYSATKLGSGTEKYLNGEQDDADLIGFKGILARWISYFAVNCNVDTYNDWMYGNAASAWTNRNSEDLMWTQFGKITQEKLDESEEPLKGNLGTETIGEFSGWGCSTAVAWLLDCTDIDAKQIKKQQHTEAPGVTAGKIALQKVVSESQALYEAGRGSCPLYAWKEFTDAYEAAANPAGDVTVAQLKAMQTALENAGAGLKNSPGSKIEAESGTLAGGAGAVNAADCSGGKRIGGGAGWTATYTVSAGRSGEYKISVYYCTIGGRKLNIIVNGVSYPVDCASNGSWDTPGATPVEETIRLNKGENTIVLGGVEANGAVGNAPNVDYFIYEKIPTDEDAALDRAEDELEKVLVSATELYKAGGEKYTSESYSHFKETYEGARGALYGREDVTANKLKEWQNALTAAESGLALKPAQVGGTGSGNTSGNTPGGGTSQNTGPSQKPGTSPNSGNPQGEEGSGDKEAGDNDVQEIEKEIAAQLGVSVETAKKMNALAEKYNISKEALLITDSTIKKLKNDTDVKGFSFARFQARATKQTKTTVTLKWNKVNGADGYLIYAAKCGKNSPYKLVKTVKGGKNITYTQKKLKKGTFYKYIVRAYKNVDGKKVTMAVSKTIHTVTKGGKYGVAGSVKVKSTKVTLRKGKTYNLAGKQVKADKKLKEHRKLKYESSNTKIATVSSSGKITAKKKGICYIYAYAQNGVYKKIKVTVK